MAETESPESSAALNLPESSRLGGMVKDLRESAALKKILGGDGQQEIPFSMIWLMDRTEREDAKERRREEKEEQRRKEEKEEKHREDERKTREEKDDTIRSLKEKVEKLETGETIVKSTEPTEKENELIRRLDELTEKINKQELEKEQEKLIKSITTPFEQKVASLEEQIKQSKAVATGTQGDFDTYLNMHQKLLAADLIKKPEDKGMVTFGGPEGVPISGSVPWYVYYGPKMLSDFINQVGDKLLQIGKQFGVSEPPPLAATTPEPLIKLPPKPIPPTKEAEPKEQPPLIELPKKPEPAEEAETPIIKPEELKIEIPKAEQPEAEITHEIPNVKPEKKKKEEKPVAKN